MPRLHQALQRDQQPPSGGGPFSRLRAWAASRRPHSRAPSAAPSSSPRTVRLSGPATAASGRAMGHAAVHPGGQPPGGDAGGACPTAAAGAGGPPVAAAGPSLGLHLTEKVVMALLMQQQEAWPDAEGWTDPAAGPQWRALLGLAGYSVVEAEVSYLREQLLHIDEALQRGDVHSTCAEHSSRLDCAAHGH